MSAAGGWVKNTNYALSDKAARNFRKAASCMWQMLTRLRETDGWNRHFDRLPVIFAELSLRVTGDNTSGRIDLAKSGVRLVVSEQAQLLRNERLFWEKNPAFENGNSSFEKRIRLLRKEPRLFDLREDASLRSASPISSFYRGVKLVPQHTWAPSCKHSLLALV